jgi:hypothetical protein
LDKGMTLMQTIAEFIQLVDRALIIATASLPTYDHPEARLDGLITMLTNIKTDAQNGQILPSNGSKFGLARYLIDWVEPPDK